MTESIMSILKGDQGQGSQILAILFICGIIALIIWGVVTLVKSSPAPAPAPAPAPTTVEQETPPPIKSITLTPGKKNTQEPEVLGYEIEKIGECVFSPEMNKDLTMTITLKVPNQIYLNTFENISLIITNLDDASVLKSDEIVKTDGIGMVSSSGAVKDIEFIIDGSVLKDNVDIICGGINVKFYYKQMSGVKTEWGGGGFTFGDDIKTSFDDIDSFLTLEVQDLGVGDLGDLVNDLINTTFKKDYYYFKGKDGMYILGNIKVISQTVSDGGVGVSLTIRVPVFPEPGITTDQVVSGCYNKSMKVIEQDPNSYIDKIVKINKFDVTGKSYYVLENEAGTSYLSLKTGIFLNNKNLNDETLIEEIKLQSDEQHVLHDYDVDGENFIVPYEVRMFDMRFYRPIGENLAEDKKKYIAVAISHQPYNNETVMLSLGHDGRIAKPANDVRLTKQGTALRIQAGVKRPGSYNSQLVDAQPRVDAGSPNKVIIVKEQYLDDGVYRPAQLQVLDGDGKVMLSSMKAFIDPYYSGDGVETASAVSWSRVRHHNTDMFTKSTNNSNIILPDTVTHVQVGPEVSDKIDYNNDVLYACQVSNN